MLSLLIVLFPFHPPGVFLLSDLATLNLQQFTNYSSGFPMLVLVPAVISACEFPSPVSQVSLYLPVCLSNLGISSFSCILLSSMDPRKVVDFFQSVQLFSRFFRQSDNFQLFTCGTKNWNPPKNMQSY